MDAARLPETAVNSCQTTRRHILDDSTLQSRRHENLWSHTEGIRLPVNVNDVTVVHSFLPHALDSFFCAHTETQNIYIDDVPPIFRWSVCNHNELSGKFYTVRQERQFFKQVNNSLILLLVLKYAIKNKNDSLF
jgi:hypothetical protein